MHSESQSCSSLESSKDLISSLSFEEALMELETLVRRLEEGKLQLEDAIQAYERGAALRRHCEEKLRAARLKVEKIMIEPSTGEIVTRPFEEAAL